jgi:hypothetical protein
VTVIDRRDFGKLEKVVLRAAAKAARMAPPQPSLAGAKELTLHQTSSCGSRRTQTGDLPSGTGRTRDAAPYVLGMPSNAVLAGEYTDSGHNILGVLVFCQNVEAIRCPPPAAPRPPLIPFPVLGPCSSSAEHFLHRSFLGTLNRQRASTGQPAIVNPCWADAIGSTPLLLASEIGTPTMALLDSHHVVACGLHILVGPAEVVRAMLDAFPVSEATGRLPPMESWMRSMMVRRNRSYR